MWKRIAIAWLGLALTACSNGGEASTLGSALSQEIVAYQESTPGPALPQEHATLTSSPTVLQTHVQTPGSTVAPTVTLALPLTPTTETPTPALTATAPITSTPASKFPFAVQEGTPLGMTNFVRPDLGCNYLGIGGQVFDKKGIPINNLIVEVQGTLGSSEVLQLALTGAVKGLGPGGFEIKIFDRPLKSNGQLRIQLFDLSGFPLTDQLTFETFSECEKNFILINFNQSSKQWRGFLPFLFNKRQ
mgnify:CR=1 FL=1